MVALRLILLIIAPICLVRCVFPGTYALVAIANSMNVEFFVV